MDYLKRESALILNQTCVTFYFLVRNLTSLKNTNTINTSFSLCKDFYVEHRGCTEWLKLINLLVLLKLTLLLKRSRMAKISKISKIFKVFNQINWNLYLFISLLIYVTPYFVPRVCDDIGKYHSNSKRHFSTVSFPCISTCMQSVRLRCERVLCYLFMFIILLLNHNQPHQISNIWLNIWL